MARFELYTDKRGEYRWRFRASNGRITATGGEGYKAKADAQAGIDRLKRDAADAPVDDITEPATTGPQPRVSARLASDEPGSADRCHVCLDRASLFGPRAMRTVDVDGVRCRLDWRGFHRVYLNVSQQVFFDGHVRAFEHLGGVAGAGPL
jgi:uncharacterized protein